MCSEPRKRSSARVLVLAAVFAATQLGCASAPVTLPTPAVALQAQPPSLARTREQLADAQGEVLVIAHRACWHGNAENSLASLEACKRLGVGIVELDVRTTADGVLVLMHDATVDRTTDGSGRLEDLTLAQVQALRLRAELGGPQASITDEAVPTLEQALAASRGTLMINIDPKAVSFDRLYTVLREHGMLDHALVKVYSQQEQTPDSTLFHHTAFMPIVAQQRLPLGVPSVAERYAKYNPVAYEMVFTDADYFRTAVPQLQALGVRVWVNTLSPGLAAGHVDADAVRDPDAHWGMLIGMGANMIQTDEPAALMEYLRQRH